jgi:hypothetical protein
MHARAAGGNCVASLGNNLRDKSGSCGLYKFLQILYQYLADELIVVPQPILCGDENQLCRLQGFSRRDRDAVGVDLVCFTVSIKAEWRNDRNNTLVQQRLKKLNLDTLDLPGKQVVDAMDDPQRMRNNCTQDLLTLTVCGPHWLVARLFYALKRVGTRISLLGFVGGLSVQNLINAQNQQLRRYS